MADIGEVVVNFNLKRQLSPAQIEAQSKAVLRVLRSTAMPRPPVRNPNGLSRRERIVALYRKQGRPQAHLDRVMRLGREAEPVKSVGFRSYGTKLESRMDRYGWMDFDSAKGQWVSKGYQGVHRDWSSYL